MLKYRFLFILIVTGSLFLSLPSLAQVHPSAQSGDFKPPRTITGEETDFLLGRIHHLQNRITGHTILILFLIGAFCALWAQNTERNPWAWFFFGVFLNVVMVLWLLWENAADKQRMKTGKSQ